MSVVEDLDESLQALRVLKAPGVTKARISSITTLCVDNVKSETLLVQKIHANFQKTPSTHKLGVLYVVDSVTRAWLEKSATTGEQFVNKSAPDGTYTAGVRHVLELLPGWMNELISSAPEDQKDKISKLVDIWERGKVCPGEMLSGFKTQLAAYSTSPRSTNFPDISTRNTAPSASTVVPEQRPHRPPPTAMDAQQILLGLTSLSQQSMYAPPPPPPAAPTQMPTYTNVQAVAAPQPPVVPTSDLETQAQILRSIIPPHIASNPALIPQYLQLLQHLAEKGVPPDQWNLVISILQQQQANPQLSIPNVTTQAPLSLLSVTPQAQLRSRSRSPRRDVLSTSPTYRERTPLRAESPSLQLDEINFNNEPKWTEYDPTISKGCIKVFSRTLFIGGVNGPEEELRQIFSRFGQVQSCIVNREKRHAFVKMCNRAGAVTAKDAMEKEQDPVILSRARSTKWGVGFGPRDCNNYQSGISIIPMSRLTEADLKWVHSAEYGGIGNKSLESGMVMEEPDIEIGAGVSSKAISRRVVKATDSSPRPTNIGMTSPNNNNNNNNGSGQRRGRRNNHSGPPTPKAMPKQQQQSFVPPSHSPPLGAPPSVPGFGFQFSVGNGGSQY